jgi:hypothetical protein
LFDPEPVARTEVGLAFESLSFVLGPDHWLISPYDGEDERAGRDHAEGEEGGLDHGFT